MWHLCCRMRGVTRHWIWGALVLGVLPSLFRGFLTTHWWTSPSVERLKSLQILLDLWDPRQQGEVVSVSPRVSLPQPFFFTMTKLRTLRLASTMQPQADLHFQSPLASNQNAPYSAAGRNSRGSRHPASWGNLVCHSHHWFEPRNPSSSPRASAVTSVAILYHKRYEVCVLCPPQWVSGSQ